MIPWWAHRLRHATLAELAPRAWQAARRSRERRRGRWDPSPLGLGVPPSWPVALPRLSEVPTRPPPADWFTDAAGGSWPTGPHPRLPRDRDVRGLWETHRLGDAALCALGEAPEARALARRWMTSWRSHNPYPCGPGWADGLEVACRVVSLILAGAALGEACPADLAGVLRAHGRYLERFGAVGSSRNNHAAGELAALVVLGGCTTLPEARRWLHRGLVGLRALVPTLIHGDGSGAEQSTAYLAFTLEWLVVARMAALYAGHGLGPDVDRLMAAAARYIASLAGGAPTCPRIGDGDDGHVLPELVHDPGIYPVSVAGAAAAVLGRPDCAPTGWHPDLRHALLGAPSLVPETRHRGLTRSGCSVLRGVGIDLVLDHGPLGLHHLGAHGHADALALWLAVDGMQVVVGRGTGVYRGRPALRSHLRGTAAHSTATVDDRDQTAQHGPWTWGRRAHAEVLTASHGAGRGEVVARHDGYRDIGVVHLRRVLVDARRVVIEDRFEGRGVHDLAVRLHLAPGLVVRGHTIHGPQLEVDLVEGGWPRTVTHTPHSSRYGHVEGALAIEYRARCALPAVHSVELRARG